MSKNGSGGGSLRLVLKSLVLWTVSALVLLMLASFILSRAGTGSEVIGYVSSAISFLCAVAAGAAAAKTNGDRPLLQGLITAVALVILLLTSGFLARGQDLNPSGILSVVTFTISGVLFGFVLLGRKKQRRNRKRLSRTGLSKKS